MYETYKKSYKFLLDIEVDFEVFPSVQEWNVYAVKYKLLSDVSMKYISSCTWHELRSRVCIEKNI